MKTFAALSMGISVAVLAACSTETLPPEGGAAEELSAGVSTSELATLLSPEPGAAAAEYEASTSRYRLFGVQLSQVPEEAFATLAETSTWETRNVRAGELLGRNLQVEAITPEGLWLAGADGTWVVRPGEEVTLRIIHHRFDRAAVHQGRHRWKVDGDAVAQIHGRYGLGARVEQVTVFGEPALRLFHLREGGVLARLGLREGDLLFSMNGKRLSPGELRAMVHRLSEPGSPVQLKVFREASFQVHTFSVEGR